MRKVWIKTDATVEPVTVTEAKLFCKVSGTGDDVLFPILIKQAREEIENFTGRSLAEKTYYAEYDYIKNNEFFRLPMSPIKSVTSVKTVDELAAITTLTLNTEYYLIGSPWTELRVAGIYSTRRPHLLIEFVAGYGASGMPVLPAALKTAILKRVLTHYDNREDIAVEKGTVIMPNNGFDLALPYKDDLWIASEV
jgi:uncharacterized phiE125 gp8 family phage protein